MNTMTLVPPNPLVKFAGYWFLVGEMHKTYETWDLTESPDHTMAILTCRKNDKLFRNTHPYDPNKPGSKREADMYLLRWALHIDRIIAHG